MATYVVSDLHGQYGVFEKGLDTIGFGSNDELYVIGDAIDRGRNGIKILQRIKEEKNMDLLIGNHELMMLDSVDPNGGSECNGKDPLLWLVYNGGRATFECYKNLDVQTRKSLLLWLKRRYVMKTLEINGTKFCLTHSYYREGLENKTFSEMEYGDVAAIVWKSIFRSDYKTHAIDIYRDYDYTFVTGHVPVLTVMIEYEHRSGFNELRMYQKGNLFDIDGACGLGYRPGINNGALFLRLDNMEVFPIPIESDME